MSELVENTLKQKLASRSSCSLVTLPLLRFLVWSSCGTERGDLWAKGEATSWRPVELRLIATVFSLLDFLFLSLSSFCSCLSPQSDEWKAAARKSCRLVVVAVVVPLRGSKGNRQLLRCNNCTDNGNNNNSYNWSCSCAFEWKQARYPERRPKTGAMGQVFLTFELRWNENGKLKRERERERQRKMRNCHRRECVCWTCSLELLSSNFTTFPKWW